ncbi:uncharacterized protein EDB93DRAFT_1247976 [Suillus bovinus]|uniref:uncharacterized protein n=1 Tax=Suillus bovinus TaxID=48563 RepID=UPI001B8644E1|nr:uncharacterized protein EDB93DRAFT_1247976 [Suillus bovinus]KAG2155020.1 hypothetical protein EDB93DRAFT_1247976 [Suillus bovinus]
MSFFQSSVNPDAERIMHTFLALVIELDQLSAIIPEEDTPFLDKEVWCRDWSKFFDNFSSCQKEAKEKGVTLLMSGEIAAKGDACIAALPKVQDAVRLMKEEAAKQAEAKAAEEERVRLAEEEQRRLASEEAARKVAKEETTAPDEEEKESSEEEEEEEEEGDTEASGDQYVRPRTGHMSTKSTLAIRYSKRCARCEWQNSACFGLAGQSCQACKRVHVRCEYSTTPPKGKKAVAATPALVAGPSRPCSCSRWRGPSLFRRTIALQPHPVARGLKRKAMEALEEEVETLDEVDEALQKQFKVMEAKCVQAEGIAREMWIGMDLIARMIAKRRRMHK